MNRKSIKHFSLLVFLSALIVTMPSYGAVTIGGGVITYLRPDAAYSGVIVYVTGGTVTASSVAVCTNPVIDTTGNRHYILRQDNILFKELYAAALLAQSTGRNVSIAGDGTCSSSLSYENVRYILLYP